MSKTLRYIAGTVVATGAAVGAAALYQRFRVRPADGSAQPLPGEPAPAPAPTPAPKPAPAPVPSPHDSNLAPVAWDGVLPLPTAAEVKGDVDRNWGIVPGDLRALLLAIEEATTIVGAARFLGTVAYQESRFKTNAQNGDEFDEQGERNAAYRAYYNYKDKNPPLMFGEQAANFGSGGLFGALAPFALWSGVQELKDKAPLLGSDPRILFLPRVAAFCAAIYLQRVLTYYEVRDMADIKVGWGSVSLLTEAGRKDADYMRIRNKWAEDTKKVGIDFGDVATIPKMLAPPQKWPGVKAVFDALVVKLPTPRKANA